MGKTRVCGGTCHKAKGSKCRCWCSGVFHGAAGADARENFLGAFGVEKVLTTEREFLKLTGARDLFTDETLGLGWQAKVERERARAQGKPYEASDL